MAETSHEEYLRYLLDTYAERPEAYYRQFLAVPPRQGDAVLDWGCGLGRLLELLSTLGPSRLAGVDLNPLCIRYVRERHPLWQVEPLAPPGLRSPFPDASFDRVFLIDVLEHVEDPGGLLAECHRVLKPGGLLTLATPDRLAFHKLPGAHPLSPRNLLFNVRHLLGRVWLDPTHVTEWSAAGLRKVLEASPFGSGHDLRPVLWHRIPWVRPPKRYYAFIVNLAKAGA